MARCLTDQGGNQIARFGAAGVKRVLMAPVCSTDTSHDKDYALVWCEEAEVYIMRLGKGARSYSITVIYWENACDDKPIEEDFDSKQRDRAITKFLKLCKREPLYADASS